MIQTIRQRTLRRAFTMIELVMVIIVLGIVSSIGASIIAQVYESYIIQRAQYRANIKTELALTQIANRLRYAIPATIGIRKDSPASAFEDILATTVQDVKVLQWVSYDGDSFEAITSDADRKPGWSGFCDVNATESGAANTISTPGSNPTLANTIISNLGGSGIKGSHIFFASNTGEYTGASFSVRGGSGETLNATIGTDTIISERYKLAWSSYALEVDDNGDLRLHYNFTPDRGVNIPDPGNSQLLLHDVTNFRFKYSGGAFRLKICKRERIGMDANATIHACKEKVVF